MYLHCTCKMLISFFVAAAVLVALGKCSYHCSNKDDIKLFDRKNKSKVACWPSPNCNDGQEGSVEPGSSHPHGTKIHCIDCPEDFFSNNHTNKRCHRCTSCGNKKELSPCEGFRDRQCSHSCISRKFYFNATDQQCYPCTECCGASDEDIVLQCVSMKVGTVIGGNGEKHCKASFNSSQGCSNEVSLNKSVASPPCGNSSVTSNSSLEARQCSCGDSKLHVHGNFDGFHIALICVLGVILVIACFVGCRWYVSRWRSSRNGYVTPHCVLTCTDPPCNVEMASLTCDEKLSLIPEEMKINNIQPYQVEVILVESLDVNRRCVKNWWDVGRMLGISDSKLQNMKQEQNREGGSPTKCLLGYLSTLENVLSLRAFVETTHKLQRHDICSAIYEFYQSQETPV